MIVTGELWPSKREIAEEERMQQIPGESVMEGVEHLGQYVYEMTTAKIKQLRAEHGLSEDDETLAVVEEVDPDGAVDDDLDEPIEDIAE